MTTTIARWMVAALLLAGCGGSPAQDFDVTEPEERTVDLAGRTLAIEGFNGSLTIVGRRDSTAVFRFVKKASGVEEAQARQYLAGIDIAAQDRRDLYRFRLRSEQAEQTRVDVQAEVPFRVPLRLKLDNGAVVVNAFAGPITVEVGNGTVTIRGAAHNLDVRSGNGDLDVEMAGFRADTEVRLRTNNGAIALVLPPSTSAAVEAVTQVGTIDVSGLPLAEKISDRQVTGGRVTGTLGEGSGRITVEAVNGGILLRGGK